MKQSEYIKLETDLKILLDKYKGLEEENKQLKEIIDKAIERLNKDWYSKNTINTDDLFSMGDLRLDLLEILRGDSNE